MGKWGKMSNEFALEKMSDLGEVLPLKIDRTETIFWLSVVIPTYNRSWSLTRLVTHLSEQSCPAYRFEIVVVDDGSSDPGYADIFERQYPFALLHLSQDHQGAVAARNLGALNSKGDILVFLDDDVVIEPGYLEGIQRAHGLYDKAIIMGAFQPSLPLEAGPFSKAVNKYGVTQGDIINNQFVNFYQCVSHNLSIKRNHFFEIGMFQDPTENHGWPNWDDVDLAFRAHKAGFQFIQVEDAKGSHMDHALDDFQVHCKRIFEAGKSANWLFKKYPELQYQLPMFQDKNPINLFEDTPFLTLRKIMRALLAWTPIVNTMELFCKQLEKKSPQSILLVQMYRWINSSYIFRGYRQGFSN